MFEKLKNEKEALEKAIIKYNKRISELESDVFYLENERQRLEEENKEFEDKNERIEQKLIIREDFYVETELKYIDTLSGLEFEEYCTNLLEKLGCKCENIKATQDGGTDIIAQKDNYIYAVQCKNYSGNVGNSAIQEVYSGKGLNKADFAIVITNSHYTKQAISDASKLNVELWDREKLKKMLYFSYGFELSHLDAINSIIKKSHELESQNNKRVIGTLEDEKLF